MEMLQKDDDSAGGTCANVAGRKRKFGVQQASKGHVDEQKTVSILDFVADRDLELSKRKNGLSGPVQSRMKPMKDDCHGVTPSRILVHNTQSQRPRKSVAITKYVFLALLCVWEITGTLAVEDNRLLQFDDTPPEEDVTPFPTAPRRTAAPSPLPSPRPTPAPSPLPTTNRPTPRPSPQPSTGRPSQSPSTSRPSQTPTQRPTTGRPSQAPSTSRPSLAPSQRPSTTSPTNSPVFSPTLTPTTFPTFSPSNIPTVRPTWVPTTSAPSNQPSFSPLAPGETRAPSPKPTTSQHSTAVPSSLAPTTGTESPIVQTPTQFLAIEDSLAPTETWQEFTVESSVRVFLELPADQRASPVGLANIWQEYIETEMSAAVANSGGILRLLNVLVLVDGQGASTPRRRRLQATNDQEFVVQTFQVDTRVDMERDSSNPSGGEFLENQADELVSTLLSAENLQGSLEDAGVEGVRVVGAVEILPDEEDEKKKKPTQVELIVGFALVGILVAMLAVTAYSRVKSMRKRRKKRRMTKMREKNSYVMPKQERAKPPPSPEKSRDVDLFIEDDSGDPIPAVRTARVNDESSDPFGEELKKAVVEDNAAWKEEQKKREQLRQRGRVVDAMYSTAAGSGEEGVEIGAGGLAATSYPYGDKSAASAASPSSQSGPQPIQSPGTQQLSPEDAVLWTTAGVALGGAALGLAGRSRDRSSSSFEPYGEVKKDASLENSWDLDDAPKEEFGQYSFMNPLRPRSSDTNQARDSFSEDSEDPSSVAVGTMSASSWTEADGTDPRASPTEKMVPLGMIREHSSENSEQGNNTRDDSLATDEMLQEVERLSDYMKRYEKKKEVQRKLSVPYENMGENRDDYQQSLALNSTSMESSGFGHILESSSELSGGVSESEDEASTRLGIKRFSVENPADSGLLYSVEELPMPSIASPEEEDKSRMLSMSGVSMDISHSIPSPMAPDKPMDRPHSPGSDLPDDERFGNFGSNRQSPGRLDAKVDKGQLSKLRGTGNMLDGEERSANTVPTDEGLRDQKRAAAQRILTRTPPPVRSKNRGFNSIVNMFESKPKNAVTPPNEDWQHGVRTPKR